MKRIGSLYGVVIIIVTISVVYMVVLASVGLAGIVGPAGACRVGVAIKREPRRGEGRRI